MKAARRFLAEVPVAGPQCPVLEMSPADRWKARARRAAGLLRDFKTQVDPDGKWTVTFDGADVEGVADTGDFVADLPELVVALGEAAQEHGQVLVFGESTRSNTSRATNSPRW